LEQLNYHANQPKAAYLTKLEGRILSVFAQPVVVDENSRKVEEEITQNVLLIFL